MISWNVRGLNNKFRRALMFQYLKTITPHVVFLQETHLDGSRVLALRRAWIQRAMHATYSTYARGVSILISKAVPCTIHHVISDPGGRFLIVIADISTCKMVLVNVYIPPPFQVQILYDLLGKLAPYMHLPLIIAGDFNAILSAALDSSNVARVASADLSAWAAAASLTELWRWKNPTTKSYSHLSKTHRSSSRIDMAFANAPMLQLVGGASYLAGGISDHTPLSVHISIPSALRGGAWRLNPGWLEVEEVSSHVAPHFTDYWKDNIGSADPTTVWDAFKACMHGHYISAIKQARRSHNKKEQELQEKERVCELAHANDQSDITYEELLEARRVLALHFTELTHTSRTKRAESIFEQGDKNGKLLAMLVAEQRIQTNIPCIKNDRGDILTNPTDIMDTFVEYYKALYAPIPVYDNQELDALLTSLNVPVLTEMDRDVLEADITDKEIETAIRAFPPHKSPGPDGFCIEWYRLHIEDMVPRLRALFHHCLKHKCLPDSFLEAQVILLPKPGKDLLTCSSYRPIALLNQDLNILTKIFATRLSQVITTLVDIDQTGFMPQISTDTNLSRLFTHLQIDHDKSGTRVVVSLDMAKAFDSGLEIYAGGTAPHGVWGRVHDLDLIIV